MNVAAVLWAAGVALRLRTMQAGPIMQMPVFLVLFFAPVYVPLPLLSGWSPRRRRRQPDHPRSRSHTELDRRNPSRGRRRLRGRGRARNRVPPLGAYVAYAPRKQLARQRVGPRAIVDWADDAEPRCRCRG